MVSLRPLSAPAGLALAASLGLLLCTASAALSQDRLVFLDNHVQDGKVVGMDNGSVVIAVPSGRLPIPLTLLKPVGGVEVAPPPAYQAGIGAYQSGQWDKALADLKPIVDQFRGIPTEWGRQSAAALGDLYLEKNDVPKAEAAFADFRKFYPAGAGNSLRFSVAQARIAFAKNNAAGAKQQLQPVAQAALKAPAEVTRLDGASYGQAFFLLGQIAEHDGDYQGALENYLRTVTLFYQDGAVANRAQKSADDLRAAHKGVAVP